MRQESIKIIEENIGSNLLDIGHSQLLSLHVSKGKGNKSKRFKIYKELLKLNTQKTNNQVKKWAEDMNRHFFKEDIQMANRHIQVANRHMKKCSASLGISEIQMKTTMRYHLTGIRTTKINKSGNDRYW